VIEFLRDKKNFLLICLSWLVVGQYVAPLAYVLIIISVFQWYSNQKHEEILIGFLYILTLSDSRVTSLQFAGVIKNAYIVILALFAYRERENVFPRIGINIYFAFFYAIALICLLESPDIGLAFQKTLSYFLLFFSVPIYMALAFSKGGVNFLKSIIWFIVLMLIIGFGMKYVDPIYVTLVGRFNSALGNPNGLGIFCLLVLILFDFINNKFPELFSRMERIIVFVVVGYSLLKSGARSSIMALLLYYFFKRFYKISPILGFITFILTIVVYEYISQNIVSIVLSLGLENYLRLDTLKDASGRLVAWEFAWQQIQKSFYLGRGFSFTEHVFFEYRLYLRNLGHQGAAHNSYLTLWLDTGLIGLVSFLTGLILFFIKIAKQNKLVMPMLFAVLFSNQYESWITASLNPFTILVLITISVVFLEYSENQEGEETEHIPDDERETANA
jgi:O-antigen ligase